MRNFVVLFCVGLVCINLSKAQNSLRWNILSLGKQFNRSNIEGANYSRLDHNRSPTSSAGLMFKHPFKASSKHPYWLGVQLSYESGKIGRGFKYSMSDSVGEFNYTSGIAVKYLSYGLGLHGGIRIGQHNNVNCNVNYYTFSAQSYSWFYSMYNETAQSINISTDDRINDLFKTTNFMQLGLEFERYLDGEHIHSLTLACSKSFMKPIYGGQTVVLNNQTLENFDYKLNYGNIRIGYCYNIYFKKRQVKPITKG